MKGISMNQSIGTPILFVNRFSYTFLPDNIGMSIGERIRSVRKERGLSQAELGELVGMAQGSISELESGASSGTTNLAKFADALKVNALWLETGKGSREPRSIDATNSEFVSLQWLRPDELELFSLFRGTDDRGRQNILNEGRRAPVIVQKPSAANDE